MLNYTSTSNTHLSGFSRLRDRSVFRRREERCRVGGEKTSEGGGAGGNGGGGGE